MNYGYDAYPDVPQLRAKYTQKDILGNTYEVAWKAIGPDGDKVGINLEGAPDSVWKKLTDINDNPLGASAQTKTLQIVPGTLDPLEVMLAGDTTDPVQVGELRIATYNQVEQNTVVVVSVNGAKAPTGLENSLNQIYGQAVASWQVHTDDITGVDYDWGFSGNGALDINTVLGNYTREMNNVISAYVEKKKSDLDNDKFYIFVMKRAEESGVAGRMPMANRVGFVFSDAGGSDGRVIAHELGHGAFNLRHPFGSDGVGTAKGSTDNLMDYSTGTHLWKHQWDNIHEPIDISFWESLVGSSDEESNAVAFLNIEFENKTSHCNDPRNWEKRIRQRYDGKIDFEYDYACTDPKDNNRTTYYALVTTDPNKRGLSTRDILEVITDIDNEADVMLTISYYTRKTKTWTNNIDLRDYKNHNLSEDLAKIGVGSLKAFGTYVLPIEDAYIVITGEDFNGEEASRLLAAGFLVLEVIPGGKLLKGVKFAKPLYRVVKGGSKVATSASRRIITKYGKEVTENMILDIGVQFTVNMLVEMVNGKSADMGTILKNAANEIDIKSAWLDANIEAANFKLGDIDITSFIKCAREIFTAIREAKYDSAAENVILGVRECVFDFVLKGGFKYIRKNKKLRELYEALGTKTEITAQVSAKLKGMIKEEYIEGLISSLIKYKANSELNNFIYSNE